MSSANNAEYSDTLDPTSSPTSDEIYVDRSEAAYLSLTQSTEGADSAASVDVAFMSFESAT